MNTKEKEAIETIASIIEHILQQRAQWFIPVHDETRIVFPFTNGELNLYHRPYDKDCCYISILYEGMEIPYSYKINLEDFCGLEKEKYDILLWHLESCKIKG